MFGQLLEQFRLICVPTCGHTESMKKFNYNPSNECSGDILTIHKQHEMRLNYLLVQRSLHFEANQV